VLKNIKLILLSMLAMAGVIFGVFRKGQNVGKSKLEKEQVKHEQEKTDKALKARREVDASPDGSAADELRDKWSRD